MAWPFSKSTKKLPKPPSPPKVAAKRKLPIKHKVAAKKPVHKKITHQKPVHLGGINAKIARLESQLVTLNQKFSAFKKYSDSTGRNINKGITELIRNDSAIVKKIKNDEKTESINHAENISKIKNLDAISRNIHSKINADTARKIKSLNAIDRNIYSRIDSVNNNIAKISSRQDAMEKSWNPAVLKRVSETLSAVNKIIANTNSRDSKNVKTLERINSSIVAVANHARDIEAEHTDAKFAAKELTTKAANLKETVDYFFRNTESLNNKINENAAGLKDIANTLDMFKDKLISVETQAAQLAEIKNRLEESSRIIDQLSQKIAYLEKSTVKTIVLE